MPESKIQFDWKITINTLIQVGAILVIMAVGYAGYVRLQDKVDRIEEKQSSYEIFHDGIEVKYISQEQLQYIVVDRIDRLDAKLERRLLELELKLEEQLNRIEEKIDQ